MSARAAGFSLLEVLIAIVILGFGITGVMTALTSSLTSAKLSEHHAQAVMQATGHVEALMHSAYLDAGERTGTFEPLFPHLSWSEKIESTELEGLQKITLDVTHTLTKEPLYRIVTQKFTVPLGFEETAEDRMRENDPFRRDEEATP